MNKTTEIFVTFGVQYKEGQPIKEGGHPLGMHGDGYAVIEAPSYEIGRDMAFAIFGDKFSFTYTSETWNKRPRWETDNFYPGGELLRIAWNER